MLAFSGVLIDLCSFGFSDSFEVTGFGAGEVVAVNLDRESTLLGKQNLLLKPSPQIDDQLGFVGDGHLFKAGKWNICAGGVGPVFDIVSDHGSPQVNLRRVDSAFEVEVDLDVASRDLDLLSKNRSTGLH